MSGADRGEAGAATRRGPTRAPRPGARAGGDSRSVSALIDAVFSPSARDDETATGQERDLQSLLAVSVRDLARRTAAPRVVAWVAREDDGPVALASRWQGDDGPACPPAATFAVLRALARPSDLGAPGMAAGLGGFARASGIGCAVAVAPDDDAEPAEGPVVLALGGPDDPPGRVRPRTLAMLDDVAARLRGPLATHLAFARLARLDEAVRGLDRRAALGELVAEIVHEVRNPLVSVKTFLQLLPTRLDDREFLEDFRSVALDEVIRLERLVDSVLQHARPSAENETRGVAGVAEAFDAIVRLMDHRATERRVTLAHSVADGVDGVAIARDALRQIVLNLTLNAIDATPAGGRVVLRARAQSVADGRWVELRVEDDGPGIAPDDRRRVFDAFYSTRPGGAGGLGLAISRRLVETAGGSIHAADAEGGGASIAVRLPAAPRL